MPRWLISLLIFSWCSIAMAQSPPLKAPVVIGSGPLTQVRLDAIGTADVISNAVTSISYNNITVGNGSNRALVAMLSFGASGTTSPTNITCTWAGTSMSQIFGTLSSANNGIHEAATILFGLVNPASGKQTLACSWTSSQTIIINAISFTNVNQAGGQRSFPNGTEFSSNSSASTITLPVNTPIGGYVVGAMNSFQGISSMSPTQIFNDETGTVIGAGANYALATGGVETLSAVLFGASEVALYSATAIAPVVSNTYMISEDFSRYANGANFSTAFPLVGPLWSITGSNLPTTSGGLCISAGAGYLFNTLQAAPLTLGIYASFSGGTDMTQAPIAMFYAANSNPFSLNDLLHFNFGPTGFILTVRQAGGAFNTLISNTWTIPMSNNGVVHLLMLSVSGSTATVTGPNGETFSVTDARIPSVVGGTVAWEPLLETDGLQGQIAKAFATWNFLLKRDLDPAANDNSPMWLEQAT